MKKLIALTLISVFLAACATSPTDGVRRTQIRDCPIGMVLICESKREQVPGSGADEEIPEYDFCRCENVM